MAQTQTAQDGAANNTRHYERHRPDRTLLYRLVEQHYPEFAEAMAAKGCNSEHCRCATTDRA